MLLKAIDKILQILDAQSVCQLKSHLAVSFGFGKARMFGFSRSLLFGFDGLVLFIVVMGSGRSFEVFVALNFGERATTLDTNNGRGGCGLI
jgi:hypothetical protein